MHDLDPTRFEMNDEADGVGEFGFEHELPGGTFARPFGESELDELAMELLSVQSEQELDEFLGSLFRRIGGFLKSPAGRALGGILRNAAKTALPILGTAVVPGVGTAVGTAISDALEVGGIPAETRDVAAAKMLLEVAGTAGVQVSALPPNAPPHVAVDAVQQAAQQHGVTPGGDSAPADARAGAGDSGSWYRRGRSIVIVGL